MGKYVTINQNYIVKAIDYTLYFLKIAFPFDFG